MKDWIAKIRLFLHKNLCLKIIVIAVVFAMILSIIGMSYAFFTVSKVKGDAINIIAGSLNYLLTSDSLNDSQVTVGSNQAMFLDFTLTSQNSFESKYQVYYTGNLPSGAKVLYQGNNTTMGNIGIVGNKMTMKIVIENPTSSSFTIMFGVKGGYTKNVLELENGQNAITTAYVAKAPTITVNPSTVTINAGTDYNLKTGVSAKDAYGKDLTSKITMTQGNGTTAVTWDNHTIGTTKIYYHVTDDYGNSNGSTSALRSITVNRVYVYYYGDMCNSITGGWSRYHTTSNSSTYYGGGYFPFELISTGQLHGYVDSGTAANRSVKSLFTYNKISLAPYKRLVFQVEGSSGVNTISIGCYNSIGNIDQPSKVIEKRITSAGTYQLDISNYTGSCYIGSAMWSSDVTPTQRSYYSIDFVWLE